MFFFKKPLILWFEDDPNNPGGGGAAPDEAKLTAAREAAKAAGTYIVHDWREAIPKELATDGSLASYKDLSGLIKSHVNAQKLIGGEKIALPKDDNPEAWEAVFNRLGRPEAPEKYEFPALADAPEGFKMDPKFEKEFRVEAHKLGLTAKQAATMWAGMQARAAGSWKSQREGHVQRVTEGQGKLKTDWGQAYPEKLKIANRAAAAIEKADPGLAGLNQWLKDTGLGAEPMMIRLFALVGEQAGEERLGPGSTRENMTPREAEAAVNAIIYDKQHPDNEAYKSKRHPRHKEVVDKVQGLLSLTE